MNWLRANKLIVLFLFTLGVSLVYSFYFQIKPVIDARGYDQIAWNVASGRGYVENGNLALEPQKDNGIGRVGPGYEFFLAFIYFIFGHKVWIIWILHALLRAFSVILIFKIAVFIFRENPEKSKIGLLAGAFFAVSPDLITYNGMLLTETFYLFLVALSVFLVFKLFGSPNIWLAFLTSIIFGVSIMTRPTIFLIFLSCVAILLFKKYWREAAILFIFPVLFLTVWGFRNWYVYDHLILTSATGGYDLWVGNNPGAKGGFEKTPEIIEYRKANGIVKSDERGWSEYFSFIKSDPIKFISLQIQKTGLYFSLLRPTGFWDELPNFAKAVTLVASFAWTAFIFLFGLPGLFLIAREIVGAFQKRTFALFAFLQPLSVVPIIVETRYRAPFFIFLSISAAYFVLRFLYGKLERKELKSIFAIGFAFLFVILLWDLTVNFVEFRSRLFDIFKI